MSDGGLKRDPDIPKTFFTNGDPSYVLFDTKYAGTCENQQLVKNGYFYVEKTNVHIPAPEGAYTNYEFKAILGHKDVVMSELNAQLGACNEVETVAGNKYCGLATALMYECFGDEDVTKNGGVNLKTNDNFKNHPEEQKRLVTRCSTIVYLECLPEKPITPNKACKAYLNAAKKAGYDVIFMVNKYRIHGRTFMYEKTLGNAITEFGQTIESADAFIHKYGVDWYFCIGK